MKSGIGAKSISTRLECLVGVGVLCLLTCGSLRAQVFDSGSDGSDGALDFSDLPPGTTVVFDPRSFDPPLDSDGDNVYHFTQINIPAGVTVRLDAQQLQMASVWWLASEAVVVDGVIDLSGENGSLDRYVSLPGAGGYPGGAGRQHPHQGVALDGYGPGGGHYSYTYGSNSGNGGAAGHAFRGEAKNGSNPGGDRGSAYGNSFIVPMWGGSGEGGASYQHNNDGPLGTGAAGAGGAGGGAFLLASSVSIRVDGAILADGGGGGQFSGLTGGGGSGGSIFLKAPQVSGAGQLSAQGGTVGSDGSVGYIRMEAFNNTFEGTSVPAATKGETISAVFKPPVPLLRVVSIDGQVVAANPRGVFSDPDLSLSSSASVAVAIEARNIPPGTQVEVKVISPGGSDKDATATLEGSFELTTATVSVPFSFGFSQLIVRALWTP